MRRTVFDAEHEDFRGLVRTFVEREVAPHIRRWESAQQVDRGFYGAAGRAGLLGLLISEEHGGGGAEDYRFVAALVEEFCRHDCLNATHGLLVHATVAAPYLQSLGTSEQRSRWLPGAASGDILMGIAMTEPGTGSDLGGIATTAVRDGDHYVLSGSKMFISNGSQGDLFVVACRTGSTGSARQDVSLLMVEASTNGFVRGDSLAKVGQHGSDVAPLFFDEVRVPVSHLLGEEGSGFSYLTHNLRTERLGAAVTAVAHARAVFDETCSYVQSRRAFGRSIGDFQAIRFELATMRTELEIAQTFVDQQLLALRRDDLTAVDAAMAKWWVTELQNRVLDRCLQLHGGYGYMEEYSVARAWRNGRVMTIYGGTTEIMKEIIGRDVVGDG